jgi:transposase-like protein
MRHLILGAMARHGKQQIVDMTLHESGMRDTARVLHVSSIIVIKELKRNLPSNK